MFKFITHRPFWVNLLAVIALVALIIFLLLNMLSFITKHDKYLKVPNVVSKNTSEAIKLLESQGFDVRIADSIYVDTAKNGIVLKMLPEGNSSVKVNRVVFLTVNRVVPPMIEMPKLEGLTTNFALAMLERNHLKLQDTIFRPDFMKGSVIEQQWNGAKIAEKAKLPWGSKITLVIGAGIEAKRMMVPDLIGMTYGEAKRFLTDNGLMLAATIADVPLKDSNSAYVYKQNPPRFNEFNEPNYISSGQLMDLFIDASPSRVAKDTSALQEKPKAKKEEENKDKKEKE